MNLKTVLMDHPMNPEMHLPINLIHITPIFQNDPHVAPLGLRLDCAQRVFDLFRRYPWDCRLVRSMSHDFRKGELTGGGHARRRERQVAACDAACARRCASLRLLPLDGFRLAGQHRLTTEHEWTGLYWRCVVTATVGGEEAAAAVSARPEWPRSNSFTPFSPSNVSSWPL